MGYYFASLLLRWLRHGLRRSQGKVCASLSCRRTLARCWQWRKPSAFEGSSYFQSALSACQPQFSSNSMLLSKCAHSRLACSQFSLRLAFWTDPCLSKPWLATWSRAIQNHHNQAHPPKFSAWILPRHHHRRDILLQRTACKQWCQQPRCLPSHRAFHFVAFLALCKAMFPRQSRAISGRPHPQVELPDQNPSIWCSISFIQSLLRWVRSTECS